jgi:glycosyltransferase involved in cell wall biosynthesis
MIDISIVIPLFNEEESLPELIQWIEKVMLQNQFTYEVWMVDDGSKDRSWDVIEDLNKKNNYFYVVLLYTLEQIDAEKTYKDYKRRTDRKAWMLNYIKPND